MYLKKFLLLVSLTLWTQNYLASMPRAETYNSNLQVEKIKKNRESFSNYIDTFLSKDSIPQKEVSCYFKTLLKSELVENLKLLNTILVTIINQHISNMLIDKERDSATIEKSLFLLKEWNSECTGKLSPVFLQANSLFQFILELVTGYQQDECQSIEHIILTCTSKPKVDDEFFFNLFKKLKEFVAQEYLKDLIQLIANYYSCNTPESHPQNVTLVNLYKMMQLQNFDCCSCEVICDLALKNKSNNNFKELVKKLINDKSITSEIDKIATERKREQITLCVQEAVQRANISKDENIINQEKRNFVKIQEEPLVRQNIEKEFSASQESLFQDVEKELFLHRESKQRTSLINFESISFEKILEAYKNSIKQFLYQVGKGFYLLNVKVVEKIENNAEQKKIALKLFEDVILHDQKIDTNNYKKEDLDEFEKIIKSPAQTSFLVYNIDGQIIFNIKTYQTKNNLAVLEIQTLKNLDSDQINKIGCFFYSNKKRSNLVSKTDNKPAQNIEPLKQNSESTIREESFEIVDEKNLISILSDNNLIKYVTQKLKTNPSDAKFLTGDLYGYFSLRVDNFRIIYEIVEKRVIIAAVGPRKKIYAESSRKTA